jgi:iron(III) transport system substrate-binding protein
MLCAIGPVVAWAGLIVGCGRPAPETGIVVVYTALDKIYSEPLLDDFERATGIEVLAVYDSEAAKTTGLVARIRAERARPRCDVFWNNEVIQTIAMKNESLLEPYASANAVTIPDRYKDAQAYWTGFAARVRVMAVNTERLSAESAGLPVTLPIHIVTIGQRHWASRAGMAYPFFGTTLTHAAVLYERMGTEEAHKLFVAARDGGLKMFDGNGGVARAVADGELTIGLTDSDDVHLLNEQGHKVAFFPVLHGPAGQTDGALLIPNTVALVNGPPHPEEARKLVDYLLSPEVERRLAASPSAQIPLHPGVEMPPHVAELAKGPFMEVPYARVADHLEEVTADLKTIFARQ